MRVDKLIRLIDEYEDIEDKALILRSQINEELESRLDYEFGIETTTDGICFVYDDMNITVKSVGDLRDFFKLRKPEMRELLSSKSLFRGGNQLNQWGCGRWYVVDDDGQKSTTMHLETACGHARTFGGEVHHISDINPA